MKIQYLLSLHLLSLVVITLSAQSTEKRIDEIFSKWNNSTTPGASVAVVKGGEVIFQKGYGIANLEYDIPNTPKTIFHVASVSKQFTVFAILLLEAEGKLSLDDEVHKYIPELPDFGSKITLRHLASHTSGLRDQWNLLAMAGWQLDDVITKDHVLKIVKRQQELNFKPGEKYTYCNTGFTLLAEIVTRVSGRTFAQFTRTKIFEPLLMHSTLFYDDHERIVKNRAYSYYHSPMGLKKRVLSYANVGATSLFTTVEDMAKWANNFHTRQIGSAEIFDRMTEKARLNDSTTFGGAMGQFVQQYHGVTMVQHGGADAGYRSYFARFPQEELAVIVLGNSSQLNAGGLALQIANIFLSEPQDQKSQIVKADNSKTVVLSEDELKSFSGAYWNEERKYMRKIFLNNDTLRYDRGNGFISPIVPIGENEFLMLRVNDELKIKFETEGDIKKMLVSVNGDEPTISRSVTPLSHESSALEEYTGSFYSQELETTYQFSVGKKGLVVEHARLPDFNLKPLKKDYFQGNRWYFSQVQFIRDDASNIKGIKVSSDRVIDLHFDKID